MNKQQGFVSIITTSIIMIIITLIVIGFSQLMQREQRQSLDRQLSSQALYAAETGINDFFYRLQNGEITDDENLDNCDVSDPSLGWPNGGIVNPDSNNEAAYTCILYDKSPASIDFNNGSVTTQQSKIFPIEPKGSSPAAEMNARVQELTFSWSGARGNTDLTLPTNCATINELPRTTANPGVPILRVDLVRVPKGEPINLNTVIDNSTYFFLYPKVCGVTAGNYQDHTAEDEKGKVIEVECLNPLNTNGYACEFTLGGMNGALGSNRFFARIKSIYNDADVRITGESTADGGGPMEFKGAQVALDVTGKSNDVLRRVKVQLGNPQYPVPEFVFQGLNGVCKGITIIPPTTAPIDTDCN